jgi:DNA polymerase-3 subunit alpha
MAAVDTALERAKQASRDRNSGQATMFGLFESAAPKDAKGGFDNYPEAEEWDQLELLGKEKGALGCYVSGHPLDRYGTKLARLGATETDGLSKCEPWSVATIAGMVHNYQEKMFRSGGGKAAFFEIEDMRGRVKAKLRGDRIDTYGPILNSNEPVLVKGKLSFPMQTEESDSNEEVEPTILVDEAVPLSDAVRANTRSIRVRLDATAHGGGRFERLKKLLSDNAGACPIELMLNLPEGATALLALDEFKVEPNERVLSGLERLFGGCVAELR